MESEQRVEVPLPADRTAPGSARSAVRELLARWRLAHLAEPVLLAVSELVTNAVRYGRAPVRLSVRRCDKGLAIGVHDAADQPPRPPRLPGEDAEGGRGMALVHAVADETGVRAEEPNGKVVWARFDDGPPDPG